MEYKKLVTNIIKGLKDDKKPKREEPEKELPKEDKPITEEIKEEKKSEVKEPIKGVEKE